MIEVNYQNPTNYRLENRYILYSLYKRFPFKLKWVRDIFSIIAEDNYEDEYIKKEGNDFYLKMDNELVKALSDYDKRNQSYLIPQSIIKLPAKFMNNDKEIETTVGRAIMNYLLIYTVFGNKLPYINEKMDIGKIESMIAKKLSNNPKNDDITLDEYIEFCNRVILIKNYNKIHTLSATERLLLPPPDMSEFKNKLLKEYINKYGKEALKDKVIAAEFDEKILNHIKEYYKDDPSYNKLLKGKTLGALKKMYGSYGIVNEFNPSPKANYVLNSLLDGYGTDRDTIVAMFNDGRLGAYSRGVETQDAGALTKSSLRATNDIEIVEKDCGTKITEPIKITEDNYKSYLNRFIVDKNKLIELTDENIKNYIGKVVNLRTPLFCKIERNFCIYCLNSKLKNRKNFIAVLINNLGGAILNESMKKAHNVLTTTVELDLNDLVN